MFDVWNADVDVSEIGNVDLVRKRIERISFIFLISDNYYWELHDKHCLILHCVAALWSKSEWGGWFKILFLSFYLPSYLSFSSINFQLMFLLLYFYLLLFTLNWLFLGGVLQAEIPISVVINGWYIPGGMGVRNTVLHWKERVLMK